MAGHRAAAAAAPLLHLLLCLAAQACAAATLRVACPDSAEAQLLRRHADNITASFARHYDVLVRGSAACRMRCGHAWRASHACCAPSLLDTRNAAALCAAPAQVHDAGALACPDEAAALEVTGCQEAAGTGLRWGWGGGVVPPCLPASDAATRLPSCRQTWACCLLPPLEAGSG